MNKLKCLIPVLVALLICAAFTSNYIVEAQALTVSVSLNRLIYYNRDTVNLYGNLTLYGTSVSDGLVGIEIINPAGTSMAFRTFPTGNASLESLIEISDVVPCDEYHNPTNVLKAGSRAYIKISINNRDSQPHDVVLAMSMIDGNQIPLVAVASSIKPLDPGTSTVYLFFEIHTWTYIGTAMVFANAYKGSKPSEGGTPYCLEKNATFTITRGELNTTSKPLTTTLPSQSTGTYNLSIKLPPQIIPGLYKVYVTAAKGLYETSNSTTFSVKSDPCPPQASFTYFPLQPYVNMSVTFDPSGSTAEGNYTDYITRYEWDFGDGSPKVIVNGTYEGPVPTVSHVYNHVGTYTVTLNVTDNEGLWSTTSKPIKIQPPTGPTAEFIWYPSLPYVNQTVTFDASSSKPGWNGTTFTPIVSYKWDFGDGNITTTNDPIIYHIFIQEANYTVTLTVTDIQSLTDSIAYIVIVSTAPALIGDINGDGIVDIRDISIVGRAYGAYPGHTRWDPRADLNGDSLVDIRDISIVGRNFGKHI